jgi:molybdopterin molybdotransferase
MQRGFDAVLVVDWSARTTPAPLAPSPDAIWHCLRTSEGEKVQYCRTRVEAERQIREILSNTPGRVLAGFDFNFSYPSWFLEKLNLRWHDLWAMLEREIGDGADHNNRFEVAASLNRRTSGAALPFWGGPREAPHLRLRKPAANIQQFRRCELAQPRQPKSAFQLSGAGAVGSQTLLGIPVLERLRHRFGGELAVWPFEQHDARITLAEVWPSLLDNSQLPEAAIRDEAQVRGLAARLFQRASLFAPHDCGDEGWILGVD